MHFASSTPNHIIQEVMDQSVPWYNDVISTSPIERKGNSWEKVGDDFNALIVDGRSPLMNRAGDEGRLATIIYALDSRSIFGHIKRGEWLVKSGIHINYDELLEEFSNISLFHN